MMRGFSDLGRGHNEYRHLRRVGHRSLNLTDGWNPAITNPPARVDIDAEAAAARGNHGRQRPVQVDHRRAVELHQARLPLQPRRTRHPCLHWPAKSTLQVMQSPLVCHPPTGRYPGSAGRPARRSRRTATTGTPGPGSAAGSRAGISGTAAAGPHGVYRTSVRRLDHDAPSPCQYAAAGAFSTKAFSGE
jgi:hypothetical protein